jgi:hypothetical protein
MSDQPPQVEVLGYDTHFQVGNTDDFNTATTWTDVFSELLDIDPPDEITEMIKSHYMQSPGQVRQKIPGWIENGVCKVKAHYNFTEYTAVKAYGRTQQSFRIVFNDPGDPGASSAKSGIMFNAYKSKLGRKPPIDGIVEDDFEFTPTGPVSEIDTITGVS